LLFTFFDSKYILKLAAQMFFLFWYIEDLKKSVIFLLGIFSNKK